jgi:hypothetical protein
MSTAAIRRRLERLEARRLDSAPELRPTVAERATRFLRKKHIEDCERFGQLYGARLLAGTVRLGCHAGANETDDHRERRRSRRTLLTIIGSY